jgi:type VI secretion system protein ImpJ
MQHRQVHWYEGLFLRPQHFQAADRHWAELLHTSEQWDHPDYHGLRYLKLQEEVIESGRVVVHHCAARLRDGTLVTASGLEIPPEEFAKALAQSERVRIWLAVPVMNATRRNVGEPGPASRFAVVEEEKADENTGTDLQAVQVRDLNVQLLAAADAVPGFEALPIARVLRAGKGGVPALDERYCPPLLALTAWPRARAQVIGVLERLKTLAKELAGFFPAGGIDLGGDGPLSLGRAMLLAALLRAGARLQPLLEEKRSTHPWAVWIELCGLAGDLAIFRPDHHLPELPSYDHDDLQTSLTALLGQIYEILDNPALLQRPGQTPLQTNKPRRKS